MTSTPQQVFEYILRPMIALFGIPRGLENKETALAAYQHALAPYPPEALQGAWIAIVASHDRSTWPLPAEIIKAVRDWIHKNVKQEERPARVDGHHDRRKFTHLCPDWMRSDLGQQALREGWGRILWDEIEIKGELQRSAASMRALDHEMRQKIAEMQSNPREWLPQVTQMGLSRLAKEAELMAEYLG